MWGRYVKIAAVLVTSQMAVATCAEEIEMGARMAESLRHVRFFVRKGRIRATPTYLAARNLRHSASSIFSGNRESVSLVVRQGVPTINYMSSRPAMTLSIKLTDGDWLVIERKSKDPARIVPLRFDQPRGTDLQLSVGTDADRRVFKARSLWHLLLAEPELCRSQLVPLLKMLRPDWRLMETAGAVEKSLLEMTRSRTSQNLSRLSALVERLGSERFEERRAAESELRRLGEPTLPYLLALDLSMLDAEQRRRVRRLTDGMTSGGRSSTMQIAARLAADRSVWLSLMNRSQADERRLAAEQLGHLLGQTIEFDADADETTRATQLQRLRSEIAKHPGAGRH